jgi:hypothetical protein
MIEKYGNICYNKPGSGAAHTAAPGLRRQADRKYENYSSAGFPGSFIFRIRRTFFYPFTFWFSGPYRAANPKGIKTKAYNYKTAGFLW